MCTRTHTEFKRGVGNAFERKQEMQGDAEYGKCKKMGGSAVAQTRRMMVLLIVSCLNNVAAKMDSCFNANEASLSSQHSELVR